MNEKGYKISIKDIRENDDNFRKKNTKEVIYFLKDNKTSTDNIKYKNEKKILVYHSSSNNSQSNYSQNNSLSRTNDQTILVNPLNFSFSDLNLAFISNNEQNSNSNLSTFLVGDDNVNNTEKIIQEKSFNLARAHFYLKNNLYDILLYMELNIKCPQKYFIADKKYAFVYLNNYTTFSITMSGFLSISKKNDDNCITDDKDEKESQFYPSVGLFFCGKSKDVIIDKKKQEKICQPDSFMCQNCMEINKRKYKIKNNYLINIKGRVAKINKGCYHCFGAFSCGNQIKDCITKFQCKACALLQENC